MNLGPFNGQNVEFKLESHAYTGSLLVSEKDARVLAALRDCGAMSANQIRRYISAKSLRPMESLVKKGFVDAYVSGKTPPVYALGRGGAEILGVPYRTWKTLELLRLVAANQLWVHMREVWPDATWNVEDDFPVLTRNGRAYFVVAPRLRQGEGVLVGRAFACSERVFVVAAAKEQIPEFPLPLNPAGVRYTWDALLKDGAAFYRFESERLVPDASFGPEKIFSQTVDSQAAAC